MASKRQTYDRNLLAEAPVSGYENYDMSLFNNVQPPLPPVPKEVKEEVRPIAIVPATPVPFWNTKAGRIVIGVVVAAVLIIALVGGALGASAAETVHRQKSQSSTTLAGTADSGPVPFKSSTTLSQTTSNATSVSSSSESLKPSTTEATLSGAPPLSPTPSPGPPPPTSV